MWIYTKHGFISVVQKPGDKFLTVRSRARADLDKIRAFYMPAIGNIRATPKADYGYRATVSFAGFAEGIVNMASDVDYPNFKAEVKKERGLDVEGVYAKVWAVMASNEDILDGRNRPAPTKQKARRMIL